METDNNFFISIIGQIESCSFPYRHGPSSQLYCRYELIAGPDWEIVSGMSTGITQCSNMDLRGNVIFNMPIEVMYKSTNPFGWPQITMSLFGRNRWGAEIIQGYARLHVPLFRRTINAPIVTAKCSNLWAEMLSWLTDKNPELKDPKVLADSHGVKGLQMESFGVIIVSLQSITRGMEKLYSTGDNIDKNINKKNQNSYY